MRKWKNMGTWASVFVVAVFLATTVTVNADLWDTPVVHGVPVPPGGISHGPQQQGHGMQSDDDPVPPAPMITVTSPNGGENWKAGTYHFILWTFSGSVSYYVKISLYKGGVLDSSITLQTENDGEFLWLIPPDQTLGSDYKIKITDYYNSHVNDSSNYPFTISLPSPSCQISWNRTYTEDGPGMRITTDTSNNIYVCGGGNVVSGIVLKYDPDGNLLWSTRPSSAAEPEDLAVLAGYVPAKEQQSQGGINYFTLQERIFGSQELSSISDIVYDGHSSVYVCGFKLQIEERNITCILYVSQLDSSSGDELWNKTFNFLQTNGIAQPMGITLDNSGDIYVTGSVMTLNQNWSLLSCYGLTIKIGPFGLTRYVKIDNTIGPSMYLAIGTDSNGYVYEAGILGRDPYFNVSGSFVIKRTIFGIILDEYSNIDDNTVLNSIVVDQADGNSIYIVGGSYIGTYFGSVSRFAPTPALHLVYYTQTPNDQFTDVAIRNNDLVVTSLVWSSPGHPYQYTIALQDKTDGHQKVKYCIGDAHTGVGPITFLAATSIAVDTQKNIVVCGGGSVIDTIKCHLIGG
jgi:hypothetical protein